MIDCSLRTFSIYAFHKSQLVGNIQRAHTGKRVYMKSYHNSLTAWTGREAMLIAWWNFQFHTQCWCLVSEEGESQPHPGSKPTPHLTVLLQQHKVVLLLNEVFSLGNSMTCYGDKHGHKQHLVSFPYWKGSINPANCPHYFALKIPACPPMRMQRSSHYQFVSNPGI
jgi:hypothetical protein